MRSADQGCTPGCPVKLLSPARLLGAAPAGHAPNPGQLKEGYSLAQVIFAGIDVSAPKLDLVCIDDQGNQLSSSRSFPNNLEGAANLVKTLESFANKFNVSKFNIGLEATSVYGIHLRTFLSDAPQLKPYSVQVYEINPSLVAGFKKAFGSKLPKTDAVDAYIIAEGLRFGHLMPYSHEASVTEPLRQLTRLRVHLVDLLVEEKNRALNLLFLRFSNYKQDNPFSKASMEVLKDFTPDEIAQMSVEEPAEFIQAHGKNRFTNAEEVANALKKAARRAYRLSSKMQEACEIALSLTLQNIEHLKRQLKNLDKVISR